MSCPSVHQNHFQREQRVCCACVTVAHLHCASEASSLESHRAGGSRSVVSTCDHCACELEIPSLVQAFLVLGWGHLEMTHQRGLQPEGLHPSNMSPSGASPSMDCTSCISLAIPLVILPFLVTIQLQMVPFLGPGLYMHGAKEGQCRYKGGDTMTRRASLHHLGLHTQADPSTLLNGTGWIS